LIPPPANNTLKTFGQWSRPAVWLIFGVRPNSLETMISVRASRPRASRSWIKAANAWSNAGICRRMPVVRPLWKSQPP
jgi:hypothetical protein